uniref:Uncharacterized protein n=1 Tax=Candidatus Kentrum sp. UNK TaxID=2126344 RepID=A0A451AMG1_9GAMM|nr:MAG: hypothetical protein BECKUNK1418G_GA0071005_11303 [Candidatus Kentron sp. UNK]VFK72698.1 MAG: hypothetical protein BECKUNK1418H_GA0071006_11321 [Candidatus Kentron sp. UNK]
MKSWFRPSRVRIMHQRSEAKPRQQFNRISTMYFIYKISANRLTPVEHCDKYPEAKKAVRSLREAMSPEDDHAFRIIFAPNTEEAERRLREKREPFPGEE